MSCPSSPSPPPPTQITSPSKKRLLANPKPIQDFNQGEIPNLEPCNDKITRDQPNLSECHGCGRRIDYSNPKARLQPIDSFWRIVLLCRRCFKQVNSGQACLYCLKNTLFSESDCFSCLDCERVVHKDCVKKFGKSPPWSYSCRGSDVGSGLGFSVCIDCWLPELLKSSIRFSRKVKNENDAAVNGDSGEKPFEEMLKEANYGVKGKIALAEKAKEKALRKAVAAQNAVKLANSVLHLADRKNLSGGSLRNSQNEGVDDTELAIRLHRAMNSSPRILKNTCSVNRSRSNLFKKTGSKISAKWMGLRSEDGHVAVGSNSELDHDGSILEASGDLGNQGDRSQIVSGMSKSVMMTFKRCNLKRNYCAETLEAFSEKSYCQNECNPRFQKKNGRLRRHEQSNAKIKGETSGDATSDRYFLKCTKKMKGGSQVSQKKVSSSIAYENKVVVLCLPAVRPIERRGACDVSLRSRIVNLQETVLLKASAHL